jgi:hypothetical protein
MLVIVPFIVSEHQDYSSERSRAMVFAIDRRASIRHSAAHNRTYVQLMDRLGRRMKRGRLVNISRDGALIRVDDAPALHQPIEVQLENAPELGWIAAHSVRFGQRHEVGIRFDHPCSQNVLAAAISGIVDELLVEGEAKTPFDIDVESSARNGPVAPSRP